MGGVTTKAERTYRYFKVKGLVVEIGPNLKYVATLK